ncbi:hypothetical protein JOJ86_004923 [Rhodococcus percolatus]|nr:hypothetical protein [Rhodococcus opacus]MBP2207197.1 hypothetical protein [Rhodococcus opacus]
MLDRSKIGWKRHREMAPPDETKSLASALPFLSKLRERQLLFDATVRSKLLPPRCTFLTSAVVSSWAYRCCHHLP